MITTALIYKPAEVTPAVRTRCSTRPWTRASTATQPARARADVHRARDRRRGHGGRQPPEVEGVRLQGVGTPTPATDRATATSRARSPPRRSPTGSPSDPTGQGAGASSSSATSTRTTRRTRSTRSAAPATPTCCWRTRARTRTPTSSTVSSGTSTTHSPAPGCSRRHRCCGVAHQLRRAEPARLQREVQMAAQDGVFAPDASRSSDHDPVIVGIDLTPPDTTAPDHRCPRRRPTRLFPPNKKPRMVTIDV